MITAEIGRVVRERAAGFCEYCRVFEQDSELPFHIEHVRPKVHRGTDDIQNLALSCPECNWHKGPNLSGVDPDTGNVIELFNPRTQHWNEHFRLENGAVVGLTSTGRTTSWVLDMNQPDRIVLRRLANS